MGCLPAIGNRHLHTGTTRGILAVLVLAAAVLPLASALAQCPGEWPNDTDGGVAIPLGGLAAIPTSAVSVAANSASGGDGGFFVAYELDDAFLGKQVYVTRVDGEGNVVWTIAPDPAAAPDAMCGLGTSPPVVCPDGAGGCYVAWGDSPACGVGTIRVARVAGIGIVGWIVSAGNHIFPAGTYNHVRMVADDAFGAWLAFSGGAAACMPATSAIYVNHVDFAGNLAFGQGALRAMCVGDPTEPTMDVYTDPLYGSTVVVAAHLGSFFPGTFGAFAASLGGVRWTVSPLTPFGLTVTNPSLACDANGNTAIAWETPSAGSGDIYLQQISPDGTALRSGSTQIVCDAPTAQSRPRVVPDQLGGAYIVWQDARNNGLYMQRVDESSLTSTGGYLFADDGIPLTEVTYAESEHAIVSDNRNGFIAVWKTTRGIADDVYAQRVSPTGQLLWGNSTGVPVLTGAGVQSLPTLVPIHAIADTPASGYGEPRVAFAVVCTDARPAGPGVRGIAAQRLDFFGSVGCAAPVLTSMGDVPGDNGGFVALNYTRSYRDELARNDIEYYSIWRRIPEDLTKAGDSRVQVVDLAEISRAQLEAALQKAGDGATVVAREAKSGMPPGLWELVGTQPAHHAALGYSYTAATRMDVSDLLTEPQAEHHFFVSAHSFRANIWWDSDYVTTFSVDNLAPPPPSSFAVQQQYLTPKAGGQPTMVLSWAGSTAPDLREYLVFRGTTPDFVPGPPATALGHTASERFQDATVLPGEVVFYRVAAIDRHGNLSAYTAAAGGIVQTGSDPAQSSVAYFLAQNQPNPASGRTVISWSLANSEPTSLQVFDLRGRLVRTLVSEVRERGAHSIAWDGTDEHGSPVAAGSYVYRLAAGSFQQSRRLLLVK